MRKVNEPVLKVRPKSDLIQSPHDGPADHGVGFGELRCYLLKRVKRVGAGLEPATECGHERVVILVAESGKHALKPAPRP
jgi:hypothetical protein